MHNFPKNISVVCKEELTLKQAKEILKLALENNVIIHEDTQREPVDIIYPYFIFEHNDEILTQDRECNNKNKLNVSLREFKNFIQGKGIYKEPFSKIIKLNDKHEAIVTKENIKVGCQSFTHVKLKELYLLSQEALKSEL